MTSPIKSSTIQQSFCISGRIFVKDNESYPLAGKTIDITIKNITLETTSNQDGVFSNTFNYPTNQTQLNCRLVIYHKSILSSVARTFTFNIILKANDSAKKIFDFPIDVTSSFPKSLPSPSYFSRSSLNSFFLKVEKYSTGITAKSIHSIYEADLYPQMKHSSETTVDLLFNAFTTQFFSFDLLEENHFDAIVWNPKLFKKLPCVRFCAQLDKETNTVKAHKLIVKFPNQELICVAANDQDPTYLQLLHYANSSFMVTAAASYFHKMHTIFKVVIEASSLLKNQGILNLFSTLLKGKSYSQCIENLLKKHCFQEAEYDQFCLRELANISLVPQAPMTPFSYVQVAEKSYFDEVICPFIDFFAEQNLLFYSTERNIGPFLKYIKEKLSIPLNDLDDNEQDLKAVLKMIFHHSIWTYSHAVVFLKKVFFNLHIVSIDPKAYKEGDPIPSSEITEGMIEQIQLISDLIQIQINDFKNITLSPEFFRFHNYWIENVKTKHPEYYKNLKSFGTDNNFESIFLHTADL